MNEKNQLDDFHVNRLDSLRYSLAASVAVWAGTQVSGIDEAEARDLFGRAALNPARFPQSVASGDPKPNGIVLWSRISPPSGGAAKVGYRVALDDGRQRCAGVREPGRERHGGDEPGAGLCGANSETRPREPGE